MEIKQLQKTREETYNESMPKRKNNTKTVNRNNILMKTNLNRNDHEAIHMIFQHVRNLPE